MWHPAAGKKVAQEVQGQARCLVARRKNIGNILRRYWEHIENILGTYSEHIGRIFRKYWEYIEKIFGKYSENIGKLLRTYLEHIENILDKYWEHIERILGTCWENIRKLLGNPFSNYLNFLALWELINRGLFISINFTWYSFIHVHQLIVSIEY